MAKSGGGLPARLSSTTVPFWSSPTTVLMRLSCVSEKIASPGSRPRSAAFLTGSVCTRRTDDRQLFPDTRPIGPVGCTLSTASVASQPRCPKRCSTVEDSAQNLPMASIPCAPRPCHPAPTRRHRRARLVRTDRLPDADPGRAAAAAVPALLVGVARHGGLAGHRARWWPARCARRCSGRLGDMYGKRRMLLRRRSGWSPSGPRSGAVAPSVEVLIAARVLQGAALGRHPARDQHHARRAAGRAGGQRHRADELVAGHRRRDRAAADRAGGRARELALAVRRGRGARRRRSCCWCAAWSPSRRCAPAAGSTCPGALGLSAALVCLLLAISRGNEWGWGSARVLGLLVAAAVLFALWGRCELRARSAAGRPAGLGAARRAVDERRLDR